MAELRKGRETKWEGKGTRRGANEVVSFLVFPCVKRLVISLVICVAARCVVCCPAELGDMKPSFHGQRCVALCAQCRTRASPYAVPHFSSCSAAPRHQ